MVKPPKIIAALLAGILLAYCSIIPAKIYRSSWAKSAFKHEQPCPANDQPRGPCPGWVIDHIWPLCAGGDDAPWNMQWQDKATSLPKDRAEWRLCRQLKTP